MNKKIGICDSGLGGIQVMKALMDANPKVDFMFIGDQLHAPYGTLSKAELFKYGAKMIHEFDDLCQAFPKMQLKGVLQPTVDQLAGEDVHAVLVMATAKTIAAHAFEKAIHQLDETCQVYELACPALVPLIENGDDQAALDAAAADYVTPYKGKVDAVILGCTHFPLIADEVKRLLNVKLYDSNQAAVNMLTLPKGEAKGQVVVCTTKDAALMKRQIKAIINEDLAVQKIDFED